MKLKPASSFLQLVLFAFCIAGILFRIGNLLISLVLLGLALFPLNLSWFGVMALKASLCLICGVACAFVVYLARWRLPHPIILGVIFLLSLISNPLFWPSRANRRQEIQAKIRLSTAQWLAPFGHQEKLDLKADSFGARLTPQGLVVVTSYGVQSIPWPLLRQAQSWQADLRAQLCYEVEGRWLTTETPYEKELDAAYWQKVWEKIAEWGLMKKLPKGGPTGLCLVRNVGDYQATPIQTLCFPPSQKLTYRGLPMEVLEQLNCPNGVTLCQQGVVIRDVCGVQSLPWSELKAVRQEEGAGGLPVVLLDCGRDLREVDPMAQSSERMTLKPDDREALFGALSQILSLKYSGPQGVSRVYQPTGTPKPPLRPIYYAGQLMSRR